MPVWKWALLLVVSFILSALLCGFSETIPDFVNHTVLKWGAVIATAAGMIAVYALFVRWFEKRPAQDIPLWKSLRDTSKGFLVGILFFVGTVILMLCLGVYKITGIGTDKPLEIATYFFSFLIVGVGEEIMFRGVVCRWIDEKWGFAAALITSAILFGAAHFSQGTLWSSVAIAIEAGLLLAAAYKWAGTLWFPIGIHWAWNFFEGNVFGFAVSGQDAGESLIQSSISGPDILTGGIFGAEASIITVVLGAALSAWFIIKAVKRTAEN